MENTINNISNVTANLLCNVDINENDFKEYIKELNNEYNENEGFEIIFFKLTLEDSLGFEIYYELEDEKISKIILMDLLYFKNEKGEQLTNDIINKFKLNMEFLKDILKSELVEYFSNDFEDIEVLEELKNKFENKDVV